MFLSLSRLEILDLSYNLFSGEIPMSLSSSYIQIVDFSSNQFNGTIPSSFLQHAWNLSSLNVSNNHFTGQIPSSTCLRSSSLRVLDFSHNNFSGPIPPGLGNWAMKILTSFKTLKVLLLAKNFKGEEMPDGDITVDSGLQNLCVFSLLMCHMTGHIPAWISKLGKLEVLDLSFNRLTGTIPGWLGTLPHLFFLLLNDNLISGEFPKELCRLPALVSQKAANETGHCFLELPVYFQRGNNATVLASQYKYLPNMPRVISLRNNSLSGSIPFEIGQLQFLQQLDLSINNFSGNIPDQIANLTKLERLELNSNRLSGKIPSSLSNLHFLSTFTVAYNNLEGPIPAGTQLQGFSVSAFEGNPKLCGAPLSNQCFPSNGNDADDNENNQDLDDDEDQSLWFELSVVLGFFVGYLGFICPLLLKRTWRYAYFQLLDNIQLTLYLKWRRLRRRKAQSQVQVPNQKDEVKSSKPDSETESTNRSAYANTVTLSWSLTTSKPPLSSMFQLKLAAQTMKK
ncbi:hypothetical protein C1H46_041352 [Malus baccata]|uniref:Leucine-rich repeat-containing N-terminal plant-type domain-containing protein n=1 Tax=Malus baccata TaxID=106549 RepID=A0A540KFW1_MALBA|nr:hypothetical protein C1H46_041352 [Malus baccata]